MSDNVYTQSSVSSSGASGCPVSALGEAFNPFVDPYLDDPYPFFARARAEEPVFYSPEIDHWVVADYEHIKTMLSDTDAFSSSMAQSPIAPWPAEAVAMLEAENFRIVPNLSNNDPPSHTQVRRFLNKAFTPKRILWLEPHVRRLVNEAIDSFIEAGHVDLHPAMLYETPARVLFAFLGIPEDAIEKVKKWSSDRALLTWGKSSDEDVVAQMPSFIEYLHYCYDLVESLEERLLAGEARDDYTSEMLAKLAAEEPEGIDKNRIALTLFGLLMAGHETTTNQSGLGIRALLNHRNSWDEICADVSLIPNAVEEIIRYDSSVIAWRRVAKFDVEVGAVTIPAGSQVLVLLGSANRDGGQFGSPDEFDIHRPDARQHMSFGFGNHFCIGAPLARLELRIFLEELTRRIPSLRLVEDQTYSYSANTSHRGPTSLLVEWDTAG
ncbi:MAG: cytochrome P450 [Candidatus Poriferisodalaceae bacterium]|jgi:cytochrome P450